MARVLVHAEVADTPVAGRIARELEAALQRIESVEAVHVNPPDTLRMAVPDRDLEIVAVITLACTRVREQLVDRGAETLRSIRSFIGELPKTVGAFGDLRRVSVEIGADKVPLEEVTDEDISRLADEAED